ncbi:M4 family metallopeptidase [Macrococcus equi]|uniref:M4 family metallopeptidase n=1 Tax=Macrococcus equi TaxID=3395462 RepID=UPI0039BDECB9
MNKKLLATAVSATLLGSTLNIQADAQTQSYKQLEVKQKVQNKQDIKNVLKNLPGAKAIKQTYSKYEVTDVHQDELRFTHYTLQPKANGRFATDKEIKVHVNPQGEVVLVNGALDAKEVNPTNTVSISKYQAIQNAFNAININQQAASNLGNPTVKRADLEIDGDKNKNVYTVEIITVTPKATHYIIKVDAQTGAIVEKLNLAQHTATTGTGVGVLGDTKTINLNSQKRTYYLQDLTNAGYKAAYSYDESTGQANIITDRDRKFDASIQRPGVDANFYADLTYKYYKNKFGRESYDNAGSPLVSIVHANNIGFNNRNNAAWMGDKIVYGDGDGVTFRPLAGAKDVVAHEITHGVTQETANLEYQGQSGALNESMSDVFAYFIDNDDATIGEDVYTPNKAGDALRSMSNPNLFNQPATMAQYVNTTSDNGGVHTNSGIPNKIAYDTVNQLGQDKAEKIYYRALTQYLTVNSTFADAKQALSQAAMDLYGQQAADTVYATWTNAGV